MFPNERKGGGQGDEEKKQNQKKREGKGEREEKEARENCPATRNDERAAQRILELKDRAAEQTDGKLGRRAGKPGMELTGGVKRDLAKRHRFFFALFAVSRAFAP